LIATVKKTKHNNLQVKTGTDNHMGILPTRKSLSIESLLGSAVKCFLKMSHLQCGLIENNYTLSSNAVEASINCLVAREKSH
jgi:hypothetical protein